MRPFVLLLLLIALTLPAGCGAISSLSKASKERDSYTLSPASGGETTSRGSRHLIVELPTAPGAIGTDQILIKPIPYQAQYLPDGRWSEPTPALVQTLLVASFQNLGGFRLVSRTANGLIPDYTLMTDVQDFQVEPSGPEAAAFQTKVSLMMTLVRESDRQIIASRNFSASETVGSDDTAALVAGFERALREVLQEIVLWTSAQAG